MGDANKNHNAGADALIQGREVDRQTLKKSWSDKYGVLLCEPRNQGLNRHKLRGDACYGGPSPSPRLGRRMGVDPPSPCGHSGRVVRAIDRRTNWGSVYKLIHSFLRDIFGERSGQPLQEALPFGSSQRLQLTSSRRLWRRTSPRSCASSSSPTATS